jgi:ABC-type branched-subunit amino acid transport system substrate-binding protein
MDSFVEGIAGTDIEIISRESFGEGETDFRTLIQRSLTRGTPDIYLLESFTPEIEVLTRQLRGMGVTTPLTSVEAFEFSNEPSLFEGLWYVSAADPGEEFVQKYENKYGVGPQLASLNVYDVVQIIISVAESFDHRPSIDELRDSIAKLDNYHGALGNLSVDDNGFILSTATVRKIENGVPVTIKK